MKNKAQLIYEKMKNSEDGFTLTEVLITMLLGSIVVALVIGSMMNLSKASNQVTYNAFTETEARNMQSYLKETISKAEIILTLPNASSQALGYTYTNYYPANPSKGKPTSTTEKIKTYILPLYSMSESQFPTDVNASKIRSLNPDLLSAETQKATVKGEGLIEYSIIGGDINNPQIKVLSKNYKTELNNTVPMFKYYDMNGLELAVGTNVHNIARIDMKISLKVDNPDRQNPIVLDTSIAIK